MQYLTLQEVLLLHARLIQRTGGAPGLRDLGPLESALARPQATLESVDLYPDLASKGAALLHALCQNHPFVDGNKRVALVATGILLELNGRRLTATQWQVLDLMSSVTAGEADVSRIAAWLQAHSEPTPA